MQRAVRRQDPHRDHQLEHDVEHPALLRRRHLRDVERRRLDGESDVGADEHPPGDQHREVDGHAAEARAAHVRGRGGEQSPLAAEGPGQGPGEEGGGHRGEEEGGAEDRQEQAVELVVLVHHHLLLHLLVDGREELDEELLRRRQPGCTITNKTPPRQSTRAVEQSPDLAFRLQCSQVRPMS